MLHAKVFYALSICNTLKVRRVLLVYTIGLNRYNVPKSTHKGTLRQNCLHVCDLYSKKSQMYLGK